MEDIHHLPGAGSLSPGFLVMDVAGAWGQRIPSLDLRAL